VVVQAWSGLHPKLGRRGRWAAAVVPPVVRGTVIRVQVSRLPKPSGPVKVLWLWWAGPGRQGPGRGLAGVRAPVRRRTHPAILQTGAGVGDAEGAAPEQADRWTWAVIAASTQLRLARHAVADLRLPWERRLGPGRLTPTRVRRGFRRLHATLPVVTGAPKPCGRGPGRPRGSCRGPARRYPAVKKNGKLVVPNKQAG
jgi:hypothetical protein